MSRSLRIIQVIMKIARVISLILFILAIIGAIATIAGAVVTFVIPFESYEIDGINLKDYFESEFGFTIVEVGCALIIGAVSAVAEVFTVKIIHNYLTREINDGTPFTLEGAKHLRRSALICFLISLGSVIISSILHEIFVSRGMMTSDYDLMNAINVAWYLLLLFLSVVFQYGAEQSSNRINE